LRLYPDACVVEWIHIGDTEGSMKDAGMRIRVEQDLREEFIAVCQTQHTPAAQVLRQFMRGYVEEYKSKASKTKAEPKSKKELI